MKGVSLNLYMEEFQKHQEILLYEWILRFAKKKGVEGGSVFRSIAGYGRDAKLHQERFFELASNVPLMMTFIMEEQKALSFLEELRAENLKIFYTLSAVTYGYL